MWHGARVNSDFGAAQGHDLHLPDASAVQQDHPGECPICGMSLEPKAVDVEDEGEIKSLSVKFWIGLALTIPVLIMAMGNAWIPHSVSKWLEFLLSTPVVLWAGGIFFIRAWRSVANRSLNISR